MSTRVFYELPCVIDVYWDYDLLVQWSLYGHIDVQLEFVVTANELLHLLDFFVLKI